MTALKLTDADDISLETFYDGSSKQVREEKLEIDRWTNYGHDRLYINAGISKCDKYSLYVDLQSHEIVSDNEGKHKGGEVEINGDTAEITIIESGVSDKEHVITVSLEGEDFEAEEDDSNDDEGETEIVADGGETDIRDSREVRNSDNAVRHYSADGHLYAYREDGEHVVVSRGKEPATRWTKRVAAERTAVVAGQQLWTIPDNWDHRLNINGAAESRYAVYNIPETGVDVLVTVPNKNHLVDAWYGVKRVGSLEVSYNDEIAWGELEKIIENAQDIEQVSDDTVEALETLNRRQRSFERKFAEAVDMYAEEALFERRHEPVSVQEWAAEPWGDTFKFDDLVQDLLEVGNETRDEVLKNLEARNVIPHYPTVRVDVDEGTGLPEQYHIRALIQAGASPPEAIDYVMTEINGLSQTEWADERGKAQPSVSKNVSKGEQHLKA